VILSVSSLILSGCAPKVIISRPSPAPPPILAPEEEKPAELAKQPNPRMLASLRLTDQGRILIEKGKPDDAIRVLERAIGLDATNGQNYYYLSEAWLLKGDIEQANEFNRLAGIYLKEDPLWMNRVNTQRERIKKLIRY
jgi:tetratricopeptide (TPR) repeat protein